MLAWPLYLAVLFRAPVKVHLVFARLHKFCCGPRTSFLVTLVYLTIAVIWIAFAVVLGALAGIWLVCALANAAPPPGSTEEFTEYYHSLTVPGGPLKGGLCCSLADCRNVKVRMTPDGGFEAWVDSATFPDDPENSLVGHAPNAWMKVPTEVILRGRENPTGMPILCFYAGQIRCFVQAGAA